MSGMDDGWRWRLAMAQSQFPMPNPQPTTHNPQPTTHNPQNWQDIFCPRCSANTSTLAYYCTTVRVLSLFRTAPYTSRRGTGRVGFTKPSPLPKFSVEFSILVGNHKIETQPRHRTLRKNRVKGTTKSLTKTYNQTISSAFLRIDIENTAQTERTKQIQAS